MEILKKFRKILAGLILSGFVLTYTVPVGVCASVSNSLPALPKLQPLQAEDSITTIPLDTYGKLSKKNPKITLSLRNSDVKQVIRMFADKAGLNILFHSSVDSSDGGGGGGDSVVSNITMDLVGVPLNEAFGLVLQVSNLTYIVKGNTMIIMSKEAAKSSSLAKQNLMILPVNYLDASKVANFLNKNIYSSGKPGLSNSNIAVTSPEKNEILLFGSDIIR